MNIRSTYIQLTMVKLLKAWEIDQNDIMKKTLNLQKKKDCLGSILLVWLISQAENVLYWLWIMAHRQSYSFFRWFCVAIFCWSAWVRQVWINFIGDQSGSPSEMEHVRETQFLSRSIPSLSQATGMFFRHLSVRKRSKELFLRQKEQTEIMNIYLNVFNSSRLFRVTYNDICTYNYATTIGTEIVCA